MKRPLIDALPLSGAGFVLRRLTTDDLAAFQAYRQDPELGRYQDWTPMSEEEAKAFLAEMASAPLFRRGSWTQIGIGEPADQNLIGDIGLYLDPESRYAEIGFTLERRAQGRGVATAAVREAIRLLFDSSAVELVLGIADARNTASLRLLDRVGMRRTQTKNAFFRGEPCVEYVYELARGNG